MKPITQLGVALLLLSACTPAATPTDWHTFFEVDAATHTIEELELTESLNSTDVTIAVRLEEGTSFLGMGYEASVRGNHASVRIRFRLGIQANVITHFDVISHQEHTGFGVILIRALETNIIGLASQLSAIENALSTTSVPNTALTETYDGMMPAIESMLLHYQAQIA
jgi:hypothetical protein